MNVLLRRLRLEDINPWDGCHAPDGSGFTCFGHQETAEHWEGIRHCRQLLTEGKTLRPLAVVPAEFSPYQHLYPDKRYQRLDGFKRYWALKLEGAEDVDCLIVDRYAPGTQEGHPMEVLPGERFDPELITHG